MVKFGANFDIAVEIFGAVEFSFLLGQKSIAFNLNISQKFGPLKANFSAAAHLLL